MIHIRRIAALVAFGVASFALASCGDAPTAPTPAPVAALAHDSVSASHDLGGWLTGLVACTPLPADSASQVIGPAGGTITVGPHSFTVPPGALDSAVTITAVAPSGPNNVVVFQPTGLTFSTPATLTLSYANCGLLAHVLPVQVAYVDSLLNILYDLPSIQHWASQSVSGQVQHFSDYAVAW